MRRWKSTDNGIIYGIGSGVGGTEITEAEYDAILFAIRGKPKASAMTDYRLREDLTWEAYEIEPPEPEEPTDADKAEAFDILTGVRD